MADVIRWYFLALLGGAAIFAIARLMLSGSGPPPIPQEEIDAEARRLIVTYGDGALEAAEQSVQRAQWAKGRNNSRERSKRVLEAVRASLR